MIPLLLGVSVALGALGVALASLAFLIWQRMHRKRRHPDGQPFDVQEILTRVRHDASFEAITYQFERMRLEGTRETEDVDEATKVEHELVRLKDQNLRTHRSRVPAAQEEINAAFSGVRKHWLTAAAETAGVLSLLVALLALVLTII